MCIAILNSPNVTFSKKLISTCWDNNPDGAGLIWTNTKAKTLHTYKELKSVKAFYSKYIEIRRAHPKTQIVLHFRISTSGGVNLTNTHPFNVSDNLAFVHNGIISELNGKEAGRSDTNLFNAQYLQHLPADFLAIEPIRKLIGKFIGGSKLVFLNAENQATIINSNLGKTDEKFAGCWFSNSTYEASKWRDVGGVKVYKDTYTWGGKTYPIETTKPKYTGTTAGEQKAITWQKAEPVAPVKTAPVIAPPVAPAQGAPSRAWSSYYDEFEDYPQTEKAEYLDDEYWEKEIEKQDAEYMERYNELRAIPYGKLTADEWEELQEFEMYFKPF